MKDKVKSKQRTQSEEIKPEARVKAVMRPKILISIIVGILAILVTTAYLLNRQSRIKLAGEKDLTGIGQIINKANFKNTADEDWKLAGRYSIEKYIRLK